MIQSFADVITIDEHTALTELASRATFVSGRESASPRLEGTKHNEQMSRDDPAITEVAKVVGAALMRHSAFRAATVPKQMHSLRLSRYGVGMRYGKHVDSAITAARLECPARQPAPQAQWHRPVPAPPAGRAHPWTRRIRSRAKRGREGNTP